MNAVLARPCPPRPNGGPYPPHRVTWINRLRIERFVWTLDQQVYDLPRSSRIARRREVRDNLLAAAGDVGTTVALCRLGPSLRLM